MDRYFSKFPEVIYNGFICKDITRSSRLTDDSRRQAALFYPIEIEAGFRPDSLADAYYEDAEMDWMIWLANDVVDPYYDWYLSENEFDSFILDKYGSFENATKRVKFYRNNWYTLEESLTPSFYENNLDQTLKKYYTPEFGVGAKIISYKRTPANWVHNTNRIIRYQLTGNSAFSNGELLDINVSGETVGIGEVIVSNTSEVIIQHVSGNTLANSTWSKTLVGETSNVSLVSTNSSIVQINIEDNEAIFWEPVSYLDWETEINENRKNLYVINNEFALDISEQLRLQLKE